MENKKQVGGKRRGAGRKPVLSKKVQISLYVEGSKILKFGNEEKYKEFLYKQTDEFGEEKLESEIKFSPITEKSFDGTNTNAAKLDEVAISTGTGLPPKLTLVNEFMADLDKAKVYQDVENVMKRAKGEVMLPRDRIALETKAKQVVAEKGLYND